MQITQKNSAENRPASQEREGVHSPTAATVKTALKHHRFSAAGKKSVAACVTVQEEEQSPRAAASSLAPVGKGG